MPVVELRLRLSNAYLIESKPPLLVDAGSPGDLEDLRRELADVGVDLHAIGLVIVTHAHADHAGTVRDLQSLYGAKVMLGSGDMAQARRGHNDELKPTSFTAAYIKGDIPQTFDPFVPDVVVSEGGGVSLAPWNIDGTVIEMPGHTAGSIVVLLANHKAFVGDQMLGGSLAGLLFPHDPGEHYYQADVEQNHRNITALLAMGVETFYLGHGGPVARADVQRAFASPSRGAGAGH